jgi:transcription initiation factor IIE alpha subunit
MPDDFLLWYLIFMDGDILICPHCKADIERYELDKAFDSQEEIIVCPSCGEKIKEEDLE